MCDWLNLCKWCKDVMFVLSLSVICWCKLMVSCGFSAARLFCAFRLTIRLLCLGVRVKIELMICLCVGYV